MDEHQSSPGKGMSEEEERQLSTDCYMSWAFAMFQTLQSVFDWQLFSDPSQSYKASSIIAVSGKTKQILLQSSCP